MMVQSIQTTYKGYRFRSRLEARWAVFLDRLGIEWEYEIEGFRLQDGTCYLPDFWLPSFCGFGMYVEVKPKGGDFSIARRFCIEAETRVWLAEGTPSIRAYDCFEWCDCSGDMCAFGGNGVHVNVVNGIPNADQAEGENRMFSFPGYENDDNSIPEKYYCCLGTTFLNAVSAARSARFEHGETP